MWKKIGIIPIFPPFIIDGKCLLEACNHIVLNKTKILLELRNPNWTIFLILRAVTTFHHTWPSEIQIPDTCIYLFSIYFWILLFYNYYKMLLTCSMSSIFRNAQESNPQDNMKLYQCLASSGLYCWAFWLHPML